MGREPSDQFVFVKQDSIGVNDAEDDKKFLFNCFIDTGDYELIQDFENVRCIILGRTGTGKTALLAKLKDTKGDRVIEINPEALAMQHISNSTIIRYLHELGIDLNLFFKLLWRHAICVEIFNHHFKISSQTENEDLLEKWRWKFKKNPRHLRALNYLEDWQHTFWKESESHVVQMISKTESDMGGAIGVAASGLTAKLTGKNKLSDEETYEIKHRAQRVVDETQMREVTYLISMLNDVVEFQQKKYYLVIDKLDEKWVEDELRYRLIKALIETVRDINKFENIKPLVVLRRDLLGHVFDLTKDTGFQEEKYASLYLNVRWTRGQLIDLIDQRISYLVRSRYSRNKEVTHEDILPSTLNGQRSIDYILDRTLMRPRDIIDFFNKCIYEATESTLITEEMIINAERAYSRDRLESVFYEWFDDYPNLKKWMRFLRGTPSTLQVKDFDIEQLRSICLEYAVNHQPQANDQLHTLASEVTEGKLGVEYFRQKLIDVFYKAGVLGIQPEGYDAPLWSHDSQNLITADDIETNTFLAIHPCFWSALNTRESIRRAEDENTDIDPDVSMALTGASA